MKESLADLEQLGSSALCLEDATEMKRVYDILTVRKPAVTSALMVKLHIALGNQARHLIERNPNLLN